MTTARRPSPFRLSVVGKGGSGKSMVAGTLARHLARRGHRILALDSDPVPGLAFSLGVAVDGEPMLDGYAERGPDGRWRVVRGLKPQTLVRRAALRGPDGVLFLQFGKVDASSLGSMISSMQAFWAVATKIRPGPWTIVHDLPAGTRQAYGGWAGGTDVFLLVVEPTQKSVLSARRLMGLRELAPGARFRVVANKIRTGADLDVVMASLPGAELAATVPFDPLVARAERAGKAPIDACPDAPAVRTLYDLAEELESLPRREAS